MTGAPTIDELTLADLTLIALYSPAIEHGFGLNDGVDEVLAGADLVEAALDGTVPRDRRDAIRQVRAGARDRRAAAIDRLVALGLIHPVGDPEFLVQLPGARPRGVARVAPVVFTRPERGDELRRRIVDAVRSPTEQSGRLLCLALLIDAGPWVGSRIAPGRPNADVRSAAKRMRKGRDTPAALRSFLAARGVDPSVLRTVIDASRVAVANSRSF
jgi:hypothetical protein